MEIKINVEESRFKDVLEKELAAFSQEELHKIIAEAMHEYLMNDEILKILFTHETSRYYENNTIEASQLLKNVVSKIDISSGFEDVKQKIIDLFNEDETINKLVKGLFIDMITNGINNFLFQNNSNFMEQIVARICQRVFESRN